MKQYTAIYSTETHKNIQYAFQAVDGNMAKRFCHQMFNTTDIIIRDEETGDSSLSSTSGDSIVPLRLADAIYIRDTRWPPMTFVIGVTKEIVPEMINNEYKGDKTYSQGW